MVQIQCSANNAVWQSYKINVQREQAEPISSRTFISTRIGWRREVSAAEGNLLDRKQTLLLLCSPSQGG